jgi:dihydroflavonol-4-reductase
VGILVTGATGFLGRHLVSLLLERGEPVRALVREGTDDAELRRAGVEVVRGDVQDLDAVRAAVHGPRVVYHAAGIVSHERKDLARLRAVNVEGTRNVLHALEPGARLVHVSSYSAVGWASAPDRPVDESASFPPHAERLPYAATKRESELLVLAAAAGGLDAVVANPGFLIGPGDIYEISTWPVKRYLDGSLRYHVRGGLSFVDARDVAAGLVTLADRGRAGERYILANGAGNLSYGAFFRRVREVTGVRRLLLLQPRWLAIAAAPYVPWSVTRDEARAASNWWFASSAKAEAELGYCTRPLDETIAETAAGYRATVSPASDRSR